MNGLADVGVGAAAVAHRGDQGLQVVVLDHHVGDLARDLGAAGAQGHADVGRLERRAVVDAVAGHGHDAAGALQGLHDLQLVRRADAGEHVHVAGKTRQQIGVETLQRARIEDLQGLAVGQAQAPAYRLRGRRLVAGDHHGLDAGTMEVGDQLRHVRAQRVGQPDQAEPGQAVGIGIHPRAALALRHPEHAQRVAGHALVGREDVRAPGLAERDPLPLHQEVAAALEDLGRAALDCDPAATFGVHVQAAHQRTPLGPRTQLHPRPARVQRGELDSGRDRRLEQGLLGRRTAQAAVGRDLGLVAQRRHLEQRGQGRPRRPVAGKRTTVDPEHAAIEVQLDHRHVVARQGAGLVQAQGLHRAQRLDRAELAHRHAMPLHLADSQGQRGGGHRRQPFRHRCDGQGDGALEHLDHADPAQEPDPENRDADPGREQPQLGPERPELPFHRRLRRTGAVDQRLDPAELGAAAGVDHQAAAASAGHVRAHVQHVDPVGQRGVGFEHAAVVLLHRHALSGQRRFIDGQPPGGQKARVRSDVAAGLELEHVPGDDVLDLDMAAPAVAQCRGETRPGAGQGGDGLLRLALGVIADRGVDQDDAQDHGRIGGAAGRHRDHCRDPQQADRQRGELLEQHLQRGARLDLVDGVRPVPGQALLHLCRSEAGLGGHEALEYARQRLAVPVARVVVNRRTGRRRGSGLGPWRFLVVLRHRWPAPGQASDLLQDRRQPAPLGRDQQQGPGDAGKLEAIEPFQRGKALLQRRGRARVTVKGGHRQAQAPAGRLAAPHLEHGQPVHGIETRNGHRQTWPGPSLWRYFEVSPSGARMEWPRSRVWPVAGSGAATGRVSEVQVFQAASSCGRKMKNTAPSRHSAAHR